MAATLSDEFTDITKALDTITERIDSVVDRDVLGDALLDAVALGHRVWRDRTPPKRRQHRPQQATGDDDDDGDDHGATE